MHKRKETLSYKVEFKLVHVYVAGYGSYVKLITEIFINY